MVKPSTTKPHQPRHRRRFLLRCSAVVLCWTAVILMVTHQIKLVRNASLLDTVEKEESSDESIFEKQPTCAILFFGLPRSYRSLVLPSIVKNLLIPNAHHNCDIFVHYFNRTEEPQGRRNAGGVIDPGDVLLLKDEVLKVMMNATKKPIVSFAYDTEDDFWRKRNATIQKYRYTKAPGKDKPLYFPWRALGYQFPVTLDNIVRQWHSVESAWKLMERKTEGTQRYTRVGMFRNDAMYLTPIDIFKMDRDTLDDKNQYAIHPPFGLFPTSDRSLYGPYDAVKVWATKRFELIEDHVRTFKPDGWGMHSERFMKYGIFPAIEAATNVKVTSNPDICFLRTRADDVVITSDCKYEENGTTRGFEKTNVTKIVERVLGRKCISRGKMAKFKTANCTILNRRKGST